MGNKIITLESEIAAIQNEIGKLKEQETQLKTNLSLPVYSGDPARFSVDTKVASEKLSIEKPKLGWIADAIAALEGQLPAKKAALLELQKEQGNQARRQRLEDGKTRLREKSKEVEELAASLESLYLEFKAIHSEYSGDFRSEFYVAGAYLPWDSLLGFQNLSVPKLVESHGRFTLIGENFDVFAAEKQAADLKERQAYASRLVESERTKNEADRRRKNEIIQQEIRQLSDTLSMKQKELDLAEETRADWVKHKYGESNLSRADFYISGLNVEVTELKTKIASLNNLIS